MKRIIFLAPYPTSENIKEGMMQRVYAVDEMFDNKEYEKTYIVFRYRTFKSEFKEVTDNVFEMKLSIWTSLLLLLKKINNADIVYMHSLYGINFAGLFFLCFFKNKNFIWDVHGIIPEEIKLAGESKIKRYYYSKLERFVIKKATKIIVVTNAMKKHLLKKYNKIDAEFLVYPILPKTINISSGFEEKDDKINILYAGNMQGYQNIALMVKIIKKIIDIPNVYFYILTGQKQEMENFFNENGLINRDNILIDSVSPNELDKYYRKAHYGFVLRDNVAVNNVACPTKIIEYLGYGLTCITLSNEIGDFNDLGFDFINVNNFEKIKLNNGKSYKNHELYCSLKTENNPFILTSFIVK